MRKSGNKNMGKLRSQALRRCILDSAHCHRFSQSLHTPQNSVLHHHLVLTGDLNKITNDIHDAESRAHFHACLCFFSDSSLSSFSIHLTGWFPSIWSQNIMFLHSLILDHLSNLCTFNEEIYSLTVFKIPTKSWFPSLYIQMGTVFCDTNPYNQLPFHISI